MPPRPIHRQLNMLLRSRTGEYNVPVHSLAAGCMLIQLSDLL
jgi:hypothetical protein